MIAKVAESIKEAPPKSEYDAIVVGGGHNGLVAAAYLAKAGKDVLVLERRHVLGGAAVSEEIHPGFIYSVCSYVVSMMSARIIRELELPKHGYNIIPLDGMFNVFPDDKSLFLSADPFETRREVSRYSRADAEALPEYFHAVTKIAMFIKNVIEHPAPDPASFKPKDLMGLLRLARNFKNLDCDSRYLHNKILTMSVVDFLQMWFESEYVISPLAVSGIIGTFLGVYSPGTAYVLLHHVMGDLDGSFGSWGLQRGGTGEVSNSIARSAISFGANIRTDAAVEKILVKDNQAVGVVLEDGKEIKAKTVVSGCDPNVTFAQMVGLEHFEPEFRDSLSKFKYRGSSGKVNLALDTLPEFTCRPGNGPHLRADINMPVDLDTMERAYDDAKYGRFSQKPIIEVVIPSLADPSVAPPGKHVMSAFIQYAPYHLETGPETWPEHREAFGDAVVDHIAEYIPNIRDIILHRQVVTPWDLEERIGMTEGNIFQGELTLEQLFFARPAPGWARYRTPVKNLWMCGSATHPGGGIMGSPGELAAKTMLAAGG